MACYRGERQTASRLRTAHCPSILQYSENNKLSSGAVNTGRGHKCRSQSLRDFAAGVRHSHQPLVELRAVPQAAQGDRRGHTLRRAQPLDRGAVAGRGRGILGALHVARGARRGRAAPGGGASLHLAEN